eukprot:3725268-Pyramimonas_sp.AAC.1
MPSGAARSVTPPDHGMVGLLFAVGDILDNLRSADAIPHCLSPRGLPVTDARLPRAAAPLAGSGGRVGPCAPPPRGKLNPALIEYPRHVRTAHQMQRERAVVFNAKI